MVVVADASPLIFLSRLGILDLLPKLYGTVLAPRAVVEEVSRGGEGLPGVDEFLSAGWLEMVEGSSDSPLRATLSASLGTGETEALLLAVEGDADLLLLDDRSGRKAAQRLQIPVRGTLGILLEGKRQHHIDSVKIYVEQLTEAGAWLSPELVVKVLRAAGE